MSTKEELAAAVAAAKAALVNAESALEALKIRSHAARAVHPKKASE